MVNVTVDPLTRIEGHLRVSTEVDANGVVTDAQSSLLLFRGFERILQHNDPRDAALLVQRICVFCPLSHSLTSTRNEKAVKHRRFSGQEVLHLWDHYAAGCVQS